MHTSPAVTSSNLISFDIEQGGNSDSITASSHHANCATATAEWVNSFFESGLYQNWVIPVIKKSAKFFVMGGVTSMMIGLYEANKDHGVYVAHLKVGGDGRFVSSEGKRIKDPTGLGATLFVTGAALTACGVIGKYVVDKTALNQRAQSFLSAEHNR